MINENLYSLTIGDHIALDMLNTVSYLDGRIVDYWRSSQNVIRWLVNIAGIDIAPTRSFSDQELFNDAIELREVIRTLVEQRKAGCNLDFTKLSLFLSGASSYLAITKSSNNFMLQRRYRSDSTIEVLSPLAEAAADLLINLDVNLLKRCCGLNCILWFYDRSKSHRRRWCSMDVCGNRHKVSRYRGHI
ncbi:CGNR zinc finger domain-containing protein [Commensalibacter nepenthis]|uniref:CGNR zinc finger domain-containing protein n=1 Tax=Commensalibacter nepenthis TaxID=3043872 RepID=A0ABT6Q7W7_9PROT|nr:CGNR zinc finger domain-containing protein [Commensalibacter sp. TBRC 10068]MDI2112990.1 CGNR zinc finger domain-containing protein [Commensalibacter sp. TBRC 10068]